MDKRFLSGKLMLTGAAALAAGSCAQRTPVPALNPNVVIILADDLGYGDLGCYGARNVETPNVNRLAEQGVRLTQAYAASSVSTPSRYSLLTGHYAWRRPDTDIAVGDAGMIIRPEQYTIADLFANEGYATGAFGKWHLGLGEKGGEQDWNAPLPCGLADIGFQESYIMAATGDRVPCVFIENGRVSQYDPSAPIEVSYREPFDGEPLAKDHPELLYNLQSTPGIGHNQAIVNGIGRIGYMKGGGKALWKDENIADSITVHALNFIEKHKDAPFFVYLATNDIHVPRFPHEEDGYQDQARELLNGHSPSGTIRGNKYGVYEAGTRVPAIVRWPARVAAGSESEALVSHIDLFASFTRLLGADLPRGMAPDSRDGLDAWLGQDPVGRQYVVEQANNRTLSVRTSRWKFVEPSDGPEEYRWAPGSELGYRPYPQLFDLVEDPREQRNVAEGHPDTVRELETILATERTIGQSSDN